MCTTCRYSIFIEKTCAPRPTTYTLARNELVATNHAQLAANRVSILSTPTFSCLFQRAVLYYLCDVKVARCSAPQAYPSDFCRARLGRPKRVDRSAAMRDAAQGELIAQAATPFEHSGTIRCRNPVRVVPLRRPACRMTGRDQAEADRNSAVPVPSAFGRMMRSAWEEAG